MHRLKRKIEKWCDTLDAWVVDLIDLKDSEWSQEDLTKFGKVKIEYLNEKLQSIKNQYLEVEKDSSLVRN